MSPLHHQEGEFREGMLLVEIAIKLQSSVGAMMPKNHVIRRTTMQQTSISTNGATDSALMPVGAAEMNQATAASPAVWLAGDP